FDAPDGVEGLADGAEDGGRGPEREAEGEDGDGAGRALDVVEHVLDGLEAIGLGEGDDIEDAVDELAAEGAVFEHEAEDGDGEDGERDDGEEDVVGDSGGELRALVPHVAAP